MNRHLSLGLLGAILVFLGLHECARAQTANAVVVNSCGSPSTPYIVGRAYPITIDATGSGCINGTITASLGAFTPNGTGQTINVTTSTASTAITGGPSFMVVNNGANPAYVTFSTGAGTATTAGTYIPAGWGVNLNNGGSADHINTISTGGSTTVTVSPGTGLATITSGASTTAVSTVSISQGSPGSTNAVQATNLPSVVDTNAGAAGVNTPRVVIATGGATVPVSAASLPLPTGAMPSSGGTVGIAAGSAVIGHVITDSGSSTAVTGTVNSTLQAGSAIAGKFGIDQTTPGTTNAVAATNFPTAVDAGAGAAGVSTLRTVIATGGATVPVSAVSLPLPSGAMPATGGTVGLVAGSAVIGHTISDSGSTTAVTGTVAANATLQAGSAIAGKFGIDQTTPGTTNAVSATNLPATADTNAGAAGASTIRTVIATGGATVPVSAAALPLPSLAATSTLQTSGGQKTQIVDGSGNVIASTSNNLNVQCANCSGSGVSAIDEASFTGGASLFAAGGGFFQTTPTNNALTTGQQGMFQSTAQRALFTNLRDATGTELGTSGSPLKVSANNLPTTADTNAGAAGASTLRTVIATGGATVPISATTLPLPTGAMASTGGTVGLVAGSSIVGKVGIDQTTPGTTNGVQVVAALPAGTAVIGHVIADSGSTTAVTGNVATTAADGSSVTLGAKADAKSTATDTTAVTIMQVLKEVSAMEQAPASRAVTNAGTFAVQSTAQAGSAIMGKVGIDQTTPGTTNGVAARDSTGADATDTTNHAFNVTCVSGCPGAITNYELETGGNADLQTSYLLTLKNAIGNPIPGNSSCQTSALAASLLCGATGARTLVDFTVTADSTLNASAWYVMIFDATSLPANGAVTPKKCYQVPSGQSQFGGTFGSGGFNTTTGLVIGVSTTGCFTLTTSTHALFIGGSYQ